MKWTKMALVALAVVLMAGCAKAEVVPSEAVEYQAQRTDLLGTVVKISSYSPVSEAQFSQAFAYVEEIEQKMSVNILDSEISRINQSEVGTYTAVSPEVEALILWSLAVGEASEGAFDVTIGAVMDLWNVDGKFAVRPSDEMLAQQLQNVDYKQVVVDTQGVKLGGADMRLDLGGIAKGYACERTLAYLQEIGVTSALLDFGGNIYAHGTKPDGEDWKIGIQSPILGETDLACMVEIRDLAMVTSGGYQRYFEGDGTIYHHIIDPDTGYPVRNGLLSVTIIGESATLCDALSTACFVLGVERGYALLEKVDGVDGVFLDEQQRVFVTSGLENRVTILDDRLQMVEIAR